MPFNIFQFSSNCILSGQKVVMKYEMRTKSNLFIIKGPVELWYVDIFGTKEPITTTTTTKINLNESIAQKKLQ